MSFKIFNRLGMLLLIVGASVIACSCMDQDPFGLSERAVVGDYHLKQWEDGVTFYLFRGHELVGGGADQPVVRIGWNEETILVERRDVFGNGKNGLMEINVQKNVIKGPFRLEDSMPERARINLIPAAEAWEKLGR